VKSERPISITIILQGDLMLALVATLCLLMPICLVAIAVRFTSKGPALYWSDRVGINNKLLRCLSFGV